MPINIDTVWARIVAHQGETFETKDGLPLIYTMDGDILQHNRAEPRHKKEFEQVLPLLPIDGPGEINGLVRGPSYIWAILHDKRIRLSDW